jgi:translin
MGKPETAEHDVAVRFAEIAREIRTGFEAKNAAREEALKRCREVIRSASCSIRAVHRLQFDEAKRLLEETRANVEEIKAGLADHSDLYWAGYVHDSQKEYVEAEAMFAIVKGLSLPTPAELGVEPAAYLNGMAEAGSECRRYVLDRLRAGEFDGADRVLAVMDAIYFELIALDFPDAVTGGLRRTVDAFRAVLERTRGDLTLTVRQKQLEQALELAARTLPSA